MKSAIFAVFAMSTIGFFMFLEWELHDKRTVESEAESVAVSFMVYRNAAFAVAVQRKQPGPVQRSELLDTLPSGYPANVPWKAHVQGAYLYVWGQATNRASETARDLARGSAAVGTATNGAIAPQKHNPVPIPGFIESGSLVSVLGLGFDTEAP